MAPVSRKEGFMSRPNGGPESKTLRQQEDVKKAPLFLSRHCYGHLTIALWEVTTNPMDWTQAERKGTSAFLTPFLPLSCNRIYYKHPIPTFCEVQHALVVSCGFQHI